MRQHKDDCEIGPLSPVQRRNTAYQVRENAALSNFRKDPLLEENCNQDECHYPNKIGNFSKGLPHNDLGVVDQGAYESLNQALNSGNRDDLENIPLAGPAKLVNPQAAYAYSLVGRDSHQYDIPAPPSINSAGIASEMAEVYWRAITRDVSFNDYESNKLIRLAAEDLSSFSEYNGPKEDGQVTPDTIFRGNSEGDLLGPLISQFLWKSIPYGSNRITQKNRTTIADHNFMTTYNEWLHIQNGGTPTEPSNYDKKSRFIRNGRDLAEWVHRDFSFQSFLNACLILIGFGRDAIDPNNPYLHSKTQIGFATFGEPQVLDLVTSSANIALEAAWFQKWIVHRRLRPEAYGGLVHNYLTNKLKAPVHQELLNSKSLKIIDKEYDTFLLPMAFPEGSPLHPAYPAGHATIAGACVTILKAFFNENFQIPDPVISSSDGLSLKRYKGATLTIGGELNKLASNIALGRDFAGVHWRSDGIEGIKLGEKVAISILKDHRHSFNEDFKGFTLTKFNGKTITIS
ncbi:phosphatase PAP2 family protein [Filobacillus milosensis]|uniref:Phosphatase PAP2 family protein n=1 Tax=Filobacillus milosensis TaxID=94137 RepID=A0A4Y8IGS7_9BACI|nr:vanadium-dependent haloperoxidase [Filobacillus milosensis]TFB14614.1 phosphatase PAP2 family protein [Filobacillus milosensis]